MHSNKRSVENGRSPDGVKMRDRILEESIKIFLRKGFSGARIQDIADAVNLSKGSLYWHFTGKNQILEKIIERFEEGFLDGLIAAVNATDGGFVEKFRSYHKHVTEFAAKMRDLSLVFTTLSAELSGSGLPVENKIKRLYEKYHVFLKGLLEIAKKDNKFKSDLDIDVTAHVIIGFNDGIFLEWYRNYRKVRGQDLAKTFRRILLDGILK